MAGVTAKKAATNARRKRRRERETARIANGGEPNSDFECNSTKDGFIPSDGEDAQNDIDAENVDAAASVKSKSASKSKSVSLPPAKRASSRAASKKADSVQPPEPAPKAKRAPPAKRAASRARSKSAPAPEAIEQQAIPKKRSTSGKAPATQKAVITKPDPAPAAAKKVAKAEAPAALPVAPATLQPTRSGRTRFPNKYRSFGMDGAGDDSDYEYEDTAVFNQEKKPAASYKSEYHLYQAITSPGTDLGKRVPKLINKDLKQVMRSSESEEDF
jgi:hypothetical protein